MVDLAEIQAAYYMVAATGVLVAAVFYILNMRETTRNRRLTLTNNLMQNFTSEEGSRRWMELMTMEWKDFDDFRAKYDSSLNPDNFAKRNYIYNTCDMLGYQYKSGQLDLGTLWSICNAAVLSAWHKFGPIIMEYKKLGEVYKHNWENFEYLAYVMSKAMAKADPEFKVPAVYRLDEYYREFKKSNHPFEST